MEVEYCPVKADALSPALYPIRLGEIPMVALDATTAGEKIMIRWSGGCGGLPEKYAARMYRLYALALRGFRGVSLFGGTRMVRIVNGQPLPLDHPDAVRHGITEVPPIIRKYCPESRIIGVVPIEKPPVEMHWGLGNVISWEEGKNYVTVIHPGQDFVLTIQKGPDIGVLWEAEYKWCLEFMDVMRKRAKFKTITVLHNGGGTTEKEILETAALGWPTLLVDDDTGGKAEEYARDKDFLEEYPNVHVAPGSVQPLRNQFIKLGALPLPAGVVPLVRPLRRETA